MHHFLDQPLLSFDLPKLFRLTKNSTLLEASEIMAENGVNLVAITHSDSRILGYVTSTHIRCVTGLPSGQAVTLEQIYDPFEKTLSDLSSVRQLCQELTKSGQAFCLIHESQSGIVYSYLGWKKILLNLLES
jgi:CBS domain-containing protein